MRKTIRIQTISQRHLLKQLNSYLGNRRIPKKVMRTIYNILSSRKLGKNGFIVLCTHKIYDDFMGLEEAVDIYPYQCHWSERMDEICIRKGSKTKSWYISYVRIKGQNTKIAVVYTTKNNPCLMHNS